MVNKLVKKNDFIELDFIGREGIEKDGDIFDTNISDEAKKIGLELDGKPFIIAVGQGMVINGLDKSLEDKEIGRKYTLELSPKEAFKERKKELIRLIPLKLFIEKKVNPRPGMTLALDNYLVKIVTVSGGRVLVDFNNPLAGKYVNYEFTIKRIIDDSEEKINAILDYFVKARLPFNIVEKKVIFELEKFFEPAITMLNEKFKEIIGLEFVFKEKPVEKDKKEDKEKKETKENTSEKN